MLPNIFSNGIRHIVQGSIMLFGSKYIYLTPYNRLISTIDMQIQEQNSVLDSLLYSGVHVYTYELFVFDLR